jgi:membrane-associated protein
MLLGMNWMDPNWLLAQFGTELFWISMLIVFVECGLFFPFLPGDTLLFALGLFIATDKITVLGSSTPAVELLLALVLLTAAALAGNIAGYEIGRAIGPPLYQRNGRILKKKYFDQTAAVKAAVWWKYVFLRIRAWRW